MVNPVEWVCPFCSRPQIATSENTWFDRDYIAVGYVRDEEKGHPYLEASARRCLNPDCFQMELTAELIFGVSKASGGFEAHMRAKKWRLLPASSFKPQPAYIPQALRRDYEEACAIRDLSAKASATLSRRCLQGMIRGFAGISRSRLIDEIKALRKALDEDNAPQGASHESVDAIDHVRNIGNIGAHMEADIDHIIDVDPGEAQALIEVIELLFEEWYVARERRRERLAKIADIAADKMHLKSEKAKALPVPERQ